jgi:hypothetical protein
MLFSKNWKQRQKTKNVWILAQSVENCGSTGKNRVLVLTQSTLGRGLIKTPIQTWRNR